MSLCAVSDHTEEACPHATERNGVRTPWDARVATPPHSPLLRTGSWGSLGGAARGGEPVSPATAGGTVGRGGSGGEVDRVGDVLPCGEAARVPAVVAEVTEMVWWGSGTGWAGDGVSGRANGLTPGTRRGGDDEAEEEAEADEEEATSSMAAAWRRGKLWRVTAATRMRSRTSNTGNVHATSPSTRNQAWEQHSEWPRGRRAFLVPDHCSCRPCMSPSVEKGGRGGGGGEGG